MRKKELRELYLVNVKSRCDSVGWFSHPSVDLSANKLLTLYCNDFFLSLSRCLRIKEAIKQEDVLLSLWALYFRPTIVIVARAALLLIFAHLCSSATLPPKQKSGKTRLMTRQGFWKYSFSGRECL